MVGTGELQVDHVRFDAFYVVADYESVNSQLEVGFCVPWPVSVAAAWGRRSFIERRHDRYSVRNFVVRESLGPAVVFAGNSENFS